MVAVTAVIAINKSVGRHGVNHPADVAAITAGLVAVGPDRGGIYGPPLSMSGLIEAIERFQRFQKLRVVDGRVDPNGSSIRRMNEILSGGAQPQPGPAPAPTGALRPMTGAESMPGTVDAVTNSPVEGALTSEFTLKWTALPGKGRIHYFELDEQVVPRWFGVVVPDGLTSFTDVHIFFHPTPGQAGYNDAQYHARLSWMKLFHYLTDPMAAQFCAGSRHRVLIMPLMTGSAAADCGMFPKRWESIVGGILGWLKTGGKSTEPVPVSSVVVSSFSAGIIYSHNFRARAGLGARLKAVIDFDSIFSTYKTLTAALAGLGPRAIRMHQMWTTTQMLGALATQNLFPLPLPRWSAAPYGFSKDPGTAARQVHSIIPDTMMYIAARRAG